MEQVIHHLIATIKYRFDHAISEATEDFWHFSTGNGVRTPLEILYHMRGLMYYAKKVITDERTKMDELGDISRELPLFYDSLEQIKVSIPESTLSSEDYLKMIQGPLADALTHIGQLAMLRRMNNQPIEKQNFMKASISS